MNANRPNLGATVMRLFGAAKPLSVEEQFEKDVETEINTLLANCGERTTFTLEENIMFCDLVGDGNLIHRSKEAARAFEFMHLDDPILVGVLPATAAARISNEALLKLRESWSIKESDLRIIGQEIAFKAPICPGQEISWEFSGYKEHADEMDLTLMGKVRKAIAIEVTTKLGRDYHQMPLLAGPIKSSVYELDSAERFHTLSGGQAQETILPFFPAVYVPSTLLRLLQERTGTTEGVNLKMDLEYFANAEQGIVQVDIFAPTRIPQPGRRPIYRFRAVTSQDTRPLNYGVITCVTPTLVDLSSKVAE